MKQKVKEIWGNTNKIAFFVFGGISVALIVASWFVPPVAVIDSSIIAATGELMGWGALTCVLFGIEKGSDIKVKKGDIEVHLDNPDDRK